MRNGAHHSGTISGVIVASARSAMDHPGRQHLGIADYLYAHIKPISIYLKTC